MSLSRYQPRPMYRPSARDYHQARRETISRARPLRAIAYDPMQGVRSNPVYRRSGAVSGEGKYFDVGFSHTWTGGNDAWTGTEIPCDDYITSAGATAAYTDSCLIPTAQGSGYGQIQGQRYSLKKIRVRGMIWAAGVSDQADIGAPTQARLILVMDTQPNGAQAQGEDIMQGFTGNPGMNVASFLRTATTTGRFRILKDEFFLLDVSAAGTDAANTTSQGFKGATVSMQWEPKTPHLVQVANGNATPTVAGCVSHNIFLLGYATRNTAAVSCLFTGAARAYYAD